MEVRHTGALPILPTALLVAVTSNKDQIPSDPSDRRQLPERRGSESEHFASTERRIDTVDRRSGGLHAIARSFGLSPEHLEAVSHDEAMDDAIHCPNCEILSRKCAELEARLAESQKEVERYRSQGGKPRRGRRGSGTAG